MPSFTEKLQVPAFMDHAGQRYHKEAAEASRPRTLEFFASNLKGAADSR